MKESQDNHGQPRNLNFNYKRNKLKSILLLKGILDGVVADVDVNNIEITYLRAWCDNEAFDFNDPDFKIIKQAVIDILEDGVITSKELRDTHMMLEGIISDNGFESSGDDSINYFLGFLNGISVDDVLHDSEIYNLREQLNSNSGFAEKWPAVALRDRLDTIFEDNIIDPAEKDDLLALIKAVSGQAFLDTGLAYGMASDFSTCNEKPRLHNQNICFTGKFISGSRAKQTEIAEKFGANVVGSINKKLNILVIGSVASRDWKFASHGNKIAKVLDYRLNENCNTEIINEEMWNDMIRTS